MLFLSLWFDVVKNNQFPGGELIFYLQSCVTVQDAVAPVSQVKVSYHIGTINLEYRSTVVDRIVSHGSVMHLPERASFPL